MPDTTYDEFTAANGSKDQHIEALRSELADHKQAGREDRAEEVVAELKRLGETVLEKATRVVRGA